MLNRQHKKNTDDLHKKNRNYSKTQLQNEELISSHESITTSLQRATSNPLSLKPIDVTQLQRVFGNQTLTRLIKHNDRNNAIQKRCSCNSSKHEKCKKCDNTQQSLSQDITEMEVIQRQCLPASQCPTHISGSAEAFGEAETKKEVAPRSRRSQMSPARQRSSGHTGPARQLEFFLNKQSPNLLDNVHGIFIDQDMSSGTAAYVTDCTNIVPPIEGASKPCIFVPGYLNRQALIFNRTHRNRIGRESREEWLVSTLGTLTHEIQHVVFENTTPQSLAGVECSRNDVQSELSELSAIMSEFPVVFRAVPTGVSSSHPARIRLRDWFEHAITNEYESISGALRAMKCACECADVDSYIRDTFNVTTRGWTEKEQNVFNKVLQHSSWNLNWPL